MIFCFFIYWPDWALVPLVHRPKVVAFANFIRLVIFLLTAFWLSEPSVVVVCLIRGSGPKEDGSVKFGLEHQPDLRGRSSEAVWRRTPARRVDVGENCSGRSNGFKLSRRLLDEGPVVVVTSVTSDRLSASLGLYDRSMEEAVEGIRTTHAKDGIISLSGVIGDIFPLDSLRLKNRNGPLWSPRSRLWSGCVSSDPRRELLEPKSSHIPLDEIEVAHSEECSKLWSLPRPIMEETRCCDKNLVISLLRSVTVPEPFRKTVISADVSLRFRIFDIKSGSIGGGPDTEAAEVSCFFERPSLPNALRPRSARVPLRLEWLESELGPFSLDLSLSRAPQSLRSSPSCANEDLRLDFDVFRCELPETRSSKVSPSIVVIWAQELRRPLVFPSRPRMISISICSLRKSSTPLPPCQTSPTWWVRMGNAQTKQLEAPEFTMFTLIVITEKSLGHASMIDFFQWSIVIA